MPAKLVVRREASAEAAQASEWYEDRVTGLGERFLEEFGIALTAIERSPETYPRYRGEIRRIHLRKFPYGVFFELISGRVVVLGIFHLARNPQSLRRSLRSRK